ncbi:MAG: class I SAM-dependent methyltransferase [Candidatus Micrarchaeota archaeon]
MRITEQLALGGSFTFEESKLLPVHSWFYYKEGYSPEFVRWALNLNKPKKVLDTFCGVGTTLLEAKQQGLQAAGVDASELAVLASKVKTQNYEESELQQAAEFIRNIPEAKQLPRWDFELFDVRAAFPKRNIGDLLSIRAAIETVENEKMHDFLLLGLLSVLPQASVIIKDGGVLKIDRRKRAAPARDIFRRKIKRMIAEAPQQGPTVDVQLGDARQLPYEDESFDCIITSPPYLNNIDYSKIYGLELSLLYLDKTEGQKTRERLLHSFIKKKPTAVDYPEEVQEQAARIPVIGEFFADMEKAVLEMKRVLKPGGTAHIVISNSVIFNEQVISDEIIAAMAERYGMEAEIAIGAYRIADVRPQRVQTRESDVILKKK